MSALFRRSGTFYSWTSSLVAGAALALALAVPAPRPAHAQDLSKPLQQDVTVSVKLIQAYVTGKDGKPVTDLTAADFEVTDNGQVVPVTHFERHFVGGDLTAPPPPAGEAVRTNRKFFLFFDFAFIDARSALKARDAGLEFIDAKLKPGDEVGLLSYSAMRGLTIHEYLTTDHTRIRKVVENFGLKSITGRAESLTNFIYADELKHMLEISGTEATPANPSEHYAGVQNLRTMDDWFRIQAMIQTGGVVDGGRTQSYVDQARAFSMTLSGLAQAMRYIPGWKNIILFSGGIARNLIHGNRNISTPVIDAGSPEATAASMSAYDAAQSDSRVREEFSAALKDLKTANSPIYAIDCSRTQGEVDINNPVAASTMSRDLVGKDSLVQLASESGGKYFSNSMDLRNALAAIEDMTSAFYVVGYSIPARWDGAFHKVKVKVKRPGCKVVSQNGYYNPKDFRSYSPFERLLQMTDLALSDNPQSQIPAEVPLTVIPVLVRGWMQMAAFVRLDGRAASMVVGDKTDAYLLLSDEAQGRTSIKSFRLKKPEQGKDAFVPIFILPVNPGKYSVRMVVQNATTGLGARGSAAVVLAKPESSPFWLDPPVLVDRNPTGTELGAAEELTLAKVYGFDPAFYVPNGGNVAAGTPKLLAALRCTLAAQAAELEITAAIEGAQGQGKIPVEVAIIDQKQDGPTRGYTLELSPQTLKPGSYTLVIVAKVKDSSTGAYASTPLTIK